MSEKLSLKSKYPKTIDQKLGPYKMPKNRCPKKMPKNKCPKLNFPKTNVQKDAQNTNVQKDAQKQILFISTRERNYSQS